MCQCQLEGGVVHATHMIAVGGQDCLHGSGNEGSCMAGGEERVLACTCNSGGFMAITHAELGGRGRACTTCGGEHLHGGSSRRSAQGKEPRTSRQPLQHATCVVCSPWRSQVGQPCSIAF